MAAFSPKVYQSQVLESIEAYFRACHECPTASKAFSAVTEDLWKRSQAYNPLRGFSPGMPYFCLRVPTGGGKTWIAAKSVALVNAHLLRTEHSVILWLVPSKPIRDQTLKALMERHHPYAVALRDAGPVTVMDLDEAKSVTRATLDTSTTVIVATRQAFQVKDEEDRKVYESSGALMHHFDHLTPEQKSELLSDDIGVGTAPYSLANVLRLRRPFVIVDEAHNSRTPLSFDTLAKFAPSGVMELTATPDMVLTPSNVLHSVSAAELKVEEMIKLPVVLETERNWQQCLADAIARRGELQQLADAERRAGAAYLRPVVLIQAEPRRQGVETLDVERVRAELQENHRIPAGEIVIATGEERGLQEIDDKFAKGIADEACPVKYVITQRALAEGWDCPFAYILVSMAPLHSATAVEQILGRVLRQPEARHRTAKALNQSYAFVVSPHFAETANALRDRLVEGAGFERKDAADFVIPATPDQGRLDFARFAARVVVKPVEVTLSQKPNLGPRGKSVREKITWNDKTKTLTISAPLTEEETNALAEAVSVDAERKSIVEAGATSRTTAIEVFQTPAELGERLSVPRIALRIQGELTLFDDPEVLDYPWDLALYESGPTADQLSELGAALKVAEGGEIDIDGETGRVVHRFVADLQRDLGLAYRPEHWDEVKLAAWLCRNIPEPSVTHTSKQAFVAGWLAKLLVQPGFDLGRANLQKFLLRNLITKQIRELRVAAVKTAYQQSLFGDGKEERVSVGDEYRFEFNPQVYSPSSDYDGRFGVFDFRKHYFGRIGDFDSKEEWECAVWLDQQAQLGRIKFWVRNLVRREGCSFFLQKADGRFYPDFICQLNSGAVLSVENKGANMWKDAEDDRLIGGLWEAMSGGRCRFVMVKDKRWDWIEAKLA